MSLPRTVVCGWRSAKSLPVGDEVSGCGDEGGGGGGVYIAQVPVGGGGMFSDAARRSRESRDDYDECGRTNAPVPVPTSRTLWTMLVWMENHGV